MVVIIVTGSVGTGKTTLAKFLADKLKYKYIDVTTFIKEKNLSEGFDKEKDCLIVDENKLAKELEKEVAKLNCDVIIDSHMSHYMDSKKVDRCFVTKCDLGVLRERLKERGYSENKIKDNLEAEIFNVCLEEAIENGHKPILIETSKGLSEEVIKLLQH
ncbi:MAG: adenylate kinase family protein [Nanoarchaeota archaeon]|nr:adenylate kinase family protein [Nanoarchaeota archaeon]